MDLNQLEYFCTVAKIEHFSKAAAVMNVSQSTISTAIAKLEEELGVALFDKIGREKRLNDAGRTFLANIEQALEQLDQAKDAAASTYISKKRCVSLATDCSEAITKGIIPFLRSHPNYLIKQRYETTPQIVKSLLEGEIDIGISHVALSHKRIKTQPFLSERVGLLVNKQHVLASREFIQLSDLKDVPFISWEMGSANRFMTEDFFHRVGVIPNVVLEAISESMVIEAVAADIGVAFFPDGGWYQNFVRSESKRFVPSNELRIIPIKESFCYRNFYLLTLDGHNLSDDAWFFYIFIVHIFEAIENEQRDFRKSVQWE